MQMSHVARKRKQHQQISDIRYTRCRLISPNLKHMLCHSGPNNLGFSQFLNSLQPRSLQIFPLQIRLHICKQCVKNAVHINKKQATYLSDVLYTGHSYSLSMVCTFIAGRKCIAGSSVKISFGLESTMLSSSHENLYTCQHNNSNKT